jgi:hypothetical protein
MTDQHRATPEQWTHVAICAEMKQQVPWATAACLLELRARIEALEAAQQDKLDRLIAMDAADPTPDSAMAELRAASAEVRPAGLVERVANALYDVPFDSRVEARAAIREVAKWLREQGTPASGWAMRLEQEADRG